MQHRLKFLMKRTEAYGWLLVMNVPVAICRVSPRVLPSPDTDSPGKYVLMQLRLYLYKAPHNGAIVLSLCRYTSPLSTQLLQCCTWAPFCHCTTVRTRANPDRSGYVFVHQTKCRCDASYRRLVVAHRGNKRDSHYGIYCSHVPTHST